MEVRIDMNLVVKCYVYTTACKVFHCPLF